MKHKEGCLKNHISVCADCGDGVCVFCLDDIVKEILENISMCFCKNCLKGQIYKLVKHSNINADLKNELLNILFILTKL